ncbi:MAG: hypothetical protein ACRDTR_04020 [Rubrobacter sp.]
MSKRDPRRGLRRYDEERAVEIRRQLAAGEACAGPVPEAWRIVEEELLDELTALELVLLAEKTPED